MVAPHAHVILLCLRGVRIDGRRRGLIEMVWVNLLLSKALHYEGWKTSDCQH